jgi:hypothetical protein
MLRVEKCFAREFLPENMLRFFQTDGSAFSISLAMPSRDAAVDNLLRPRRSKGPAIGGPHKSQGSDVPYSLGVH